MITSHQRRLDRVREQLNLRGLDGMYVTNLTNVRYLTGFTGSAGQVLILPDSQHFFSDTRYNEQSKKEVKNYHIQMVDTGYMAYFKKNNLINNGLKLGFEADHTSVKIFGSMSKEFPTIQWEEISGLIEHIAAVKDESEIQALKTAIEITDQVFEEILPEMKVGAVERQIAAKISYLFKMHGAEGDSYDPIIASGWLSALPHATPSDKEFEDGDFVVMDIGALYDGYHADMTRTVVIGKATDKHRDIYDSVLASHLAGLGAAKAGMTGAELDKICRDVIVERNYGDKFIHSTGHGIGLEVHTYPRISKLNDKPLLENYVITIEPGIYIPGFGGVRIEDDCWIHADNCTPLNRSTKELLELK